ncbi:hypothetical protein TSTA_037150 [Talaromyces stipitatus ATCC 10500]|uniref:F-box domain-containing protein n=1 Tax=Talaromyces stipitatus (strain ATCC 10500 / CBS 375.48 / QM 6759 / NRRL 1006) TaxID=441959 RepID=B8M8I2_TALSN|nr:uncharacterized protein TSTA_037150 [Talaromyces stipitatus ATCC 10500]EED20495.1 hypothetical protein TSTA_037150 [Talaromyces stipitatus ATCC 10500]
MAANLCSLPLETLIEVCKHLDPADFVSTVRVNKDLYRRLRGNQPGKFILESVARWSREAYTARAGEIKFWEALNSYYNRIQASAKASPYSVAVLPDTSEFIYQDGVVVYVMNYEIRIRGVYRNAETEEVINLDAALNQIIPSNQWIINDMVLLYYYSNILAFQVKLNRGSWLLVVDTRQEHYKIKTDLPEVEEIFVRHNGLHLFVVFYSEHYNWHWAIRKFDLLQEIEIGEPTILDDFGDFGDTSQGVCFEIFGDNLHGVSNHMTRTELRSDRSFYKWICLAPDSKSRRITAKKLFRRYHDLHEGVLKYAELSLQVDESTGRPMILECRHERRGLDEISCRTYYGELLPGPEEFNDGEQTVDLPLLGPTREELRAYRSDKLVHPEYSSEFCERLDFSLPNTMYSFYNSSSGTFLDLINDPVPNSLVATPEKRFRLRLNSHRCTGSDKKHVSTQLWPSDNNVGLMNPFGTSFQNKVVFAKADERSVIYSMTSDTETKAIILISFDPTIRFSYMHHEKRETVNQSPFKPEQWVRTEPATRFQWVWDRENTANSL